MSKVISIEQAVSMIPDGAAIGIGGFIGSGHPQEFSVGIEESFLKSGHPKDLTIMFSAGIGDGTDRLGLNLSLIHIYPQCLGQHTSAHAE